MISDPALQDSDGPAVDVRVLGHVEVIIDGHLVRLGSQRVRVLLALLVMSANSVVPVDHIVDAVWETSPASARQQVHNIVGALRRSLAPAKGRLEVVTSDVGYRLEAPSDAIDMLRFELQTEAAEQAASAGDLEVASDYLMRALAEWRGSAAAGMTGRHVSSLAARLNERRVAITEKLADLQHQQGDAAQSVSMLLELVGEFPYRESLRVALMRALHESGRQAEALAVFNEGRRLLADELGLDPGQELRQMQQQVLAGDVHKPAASTEDRALSRDRCHAAAQPSRRFLPRDIPAFTGRAPEVHRLVTEAKAASLPALIISAIDGMGGVGKTALAVHVAHQLADDYPDGQYFVDLLGFSPGTDPLPPQQALNHLLRSFGLPPEMIRPDLDGRSQQWRACLAGERAILLLDNAADVAQVRPLLPGSPETLVIISSRRRMTALEGALPLSLDVLPQADAVALFEQVVGQGRTSGEPAAVAAAVDSCGRLPLAIQVAAARLRDRPAWTVGHLVEQLRDARSRSRLLAVGDRNVMDVLAWSYRHLSPPLRAVFRLLHLHPGPDIDAFAVAALARLSLDDAERSLDELFEVNLLTQRMPTQYQLHDLVRECSRRMLEEHGDGDEVSAGTDRLIDYYLRSTSTWCSPITNFGSEIVVDVAHEPRFIKAVHSAAEAAAMLDAEIRNLTSMIQIATDDGRTTATWQLTCALLPYFIWLKQGSDIEAMVDKALQAAQTARSIRGQSACLMGLARIKRSQGANTEAVDLAAKAAELSRQDGNRIIETAQRTAMGVMYLDDNRFDEAYSCFLEALELSHDLNDLHAEANLTNNLGVISRELGNFDEAIRYFCRTLELDGRAGQQISSSETLSNMGRVALFQGNPFQAGEYFEDALDVARSGASLRPEVIARCGLCTAHRTRGEVAEAKQHGRTALDLARTIDAYDLEGDVLNALGDLHVQLGNLTLAEDIFRQVADLAEQYSSPRYKARADEGLGHVFLARGQRGKAEDYWRIALSVFPGGVEHPADTRRHLINAQATCWRCAQVSAACRR